MSAAIRRPPERESRPGDYSETASKSTARTDHDHTYVTALHRRRAASWRIVDGDPWRYEPPVGGYGLAAAHLLELGLTPAPSLGCLRRMWNSGGRQRLDAEIIAERWDLAS
jgi:hypothetical protein